MREVQVPDYFAEDLFSVLGEDKRPDYRWLIMVRSSTSQRLLAFRKAFSNQCKADRRYQVFSTAVFGDFVDAPSWFVSPCYKC